MKLKNGVHRKKDIMYIIIAVVLTTGLAFYLFWLVKGLTEKANKAFGTESVSQSIPTFDFERYDELMQKISSASSSQR